MPAPDGGSPAGVPSATGLTGWRECSRESSRSEWCRRRLSSGEGSQSGKKCRWGWFPSPACSFRLARVSASSSSASSGVDVQDGVMLPPSAGRLGAGGGHSKRDLSAAGRDRSPHPGPSDLGLGSLSSPVAGLSRSGDDGRSSPSPSGAGDDDSSSRVDSLDLDRDDSFRAVLRLVWEFHSFEEPASVAPNWCKTSLAPDFFCTGFRATVSLSRLFTCLLPLYCGLSLMTRTWRWPSLWSPEFQTIVSRSVPLSVRETAGLKTTVLQPPVVNEDWPDHPLLDHFQRSFSRGTLKSTSCYRILSSIRRISLCLPPLRRLSRRQGMLSI